jgi:signal transduction histidine kinase/ligand-binding sensor domain-containing protein
MQGGRLVPAFPRGLIPRVLGGLFVCASFVSALGLARGAFAGDLDAERSNGVRPPEPIAALAASPGGGLWVATASGLHRYDGRRFEAHPLVAPGSPITAVHETDGATPTLWWASRSPPRLVREQGSARAAWPGPAGVTRINALLVHQGRLWLATDRGLWTLDAAGSGQFTRESALGTGEITALLGQGGALWVASRDGVVHMGRTGSAATRLSSGAPVLALASWEGGALAGGPGGLLEIVASDPTRATRPAFAPGSATARAVADRTIVALQRDREGNLWIATDRDLVRVPRALPLAVMSGGYDHGEIQGNPHEVLSVRPLSDGSVAGIGAHHLFRWREGLLVERVTSKQTLVGLLEDRRGAVLVGSWTGELLQLRAGRLESVVYPGRQGRETIRPLLSAANGDWFAVGADKLLQRRDGTFVWHRLASLGIGSEILSGVEDERGELWFTTEHSGLLHVHDAGLERIGRNHGLPTEDLTQLARARDRGLWIGTRANGLLLLQDGRFATIDARRGLPDGGIAAVVPTPSGWLWLSTPEQGIARLREAEALAAANGDPAPLRVIRYTSSDGLPAMGSAWWSPPAGAYDQQGQVWLALKHHAVAFANVATLTTLPQPVPQILDVRLDGQRLAAGAAIVTSGPGTLEAHFGAHLIEGNAQVEQRYRLDGQDPSLDQVWRATGESAEAVYARFHVRPGRYVLRTAARRADRPDQAMAETSFAFVVLAPWYQRTSVRVALALAFLLALLALGQLTVVLRVRRVALRLAAINEERLRISRDVHDSLAQTLYAARLQLDAADEGPADGVPTPASRAAALISRAMEETRAAVWSLRTGPFGAHDLPTAISLTARELLAHRGLELRIETTGEPYRLPSETEWQLGQIFREALANALKHGSPSSVRVGMQFKRDWFRLEVADNGRGLPALQTGPSRAGHHGLQNMRERLAQLGGRLRLESAPAAGTTLSLELPRAAGEPS